MFNTDAFNSWSTILAGACLFALLFTLLGTMSELVLEGTLRISKYVVMLGLLAFVGYIMVALIIRLYPHLLQREKKL